MVASKLSCAVGIILIVNYAPANGRCNIMQCPRTWSQWQDKCYKIHDDQVTWEDGEQKCAEMGGVIVVPQSQEELQHLVFIGNGDWFWIGCNDIQIEGTWVCLDGEGTIGEQDKRWRYDQPNSLGGEEDCATACDASGWRDRDCGEAFKLICQRPVSPEPILI